MDNDIKTWAELDALNRADGHYNRKAQPNTIRTLYEKKQNAWREHTRIVSEEYDDVPDPQPNYDRINAALATALAAETEYIKAYRDYYDYYECGCNGANGTCSSCAGWRERERELAPLIAQVESWKEEQETENV